MNIQHIEKGDSLIVTDHGYTRASQPPHWNKNGQMIRYQGHVGTVRMITGEQVWMEFDGAEFWFFAHELHPIDQPDEGPKVIALLNKILKKVDRIEAELRRLDAQKTAKK